MVGMQAKGGHVLSRTPCRKVSPASIQRPHLIPRESAQNAAAMVQHDPPLLPQKQTGWDFFGAVEKGVDETAG